MENQQMPPPESWMPLPEIDPNIPEDQPQYPEDPGTSLEALTAGAIAELIQKSRESSPATPNSPTPPIPKWFRKAYENF